MNPYMHFSPETKKLLFAALVTERNKMAVLKIDLSTQPLEPKLKATLLNKCSEKILLLTHQLNECRRSTNEKLTLSI